MIQWLSKSIPRLGALLSTFIKNMRPIINSFGNALLWLVLTLFFGLIQTVISFFLSLFFVDIKFDLGLQLKEIGWFFFSLALSSAATIDLSFSKVAGKYTVLAATVPISIALLAAIAYAALQTQNMDDQFSITISNIENANWYALLVSCLHAIVIKSYLFHLEKKENAKRTTDNSTDNTHS